jgi:hypothetical protein
MNYDEFGTIEITPPKGMSRDSITAQLVNPIAKLFFAVERDRGNGPELISDLFPGLAITVKKK